MDSRARRVTRSEDARQLLDPPPRTSYLPRLVAVGRSFVEVRSEGVTQSCRSIRRRPSSSMAAALREREASDTVERSIGPRSQGLISLPVSFP